MSSVIDPSARMWAVIDNNTNAVLNIVVWDGSSPWSEPDNTYLIEVTNIAGVQIGYVYNKTVKEFFPPA